MTPDFKIEYGTLKQYIGPGGDVVIPDEVSEIAENAFWCCKTITSVVIPNTVKRVGSAAFAWCENLERVILPEGITRIENGTFGKCVKLRDVKFPTTLKEIGAGAFYGCESLTGLDLPDGLEQIEETWWGGWGGCFQECKNLTRIRIPASLTNVYGTVFRGCSALKDIEVDPANPTLAMEGGLLINKTEHVIQFCPPGITGVVEIPEGITSLPRACFENCTGLTGVKFPVTMESLDGEAFMGCTGLTSVEFLDGMKVGFRTFSGCVNLKEVILPSDLGSIDDDFFEGCTSLTSITLPKDLRNIGHHAFKDCGLKSITIPAGVTDVSWAAFHGCKDLTEILVDPTNEAYDSVDGMLVRKVANWSGSGETLERCPEGKTGICSIPAQIVSISNPAFDGCTGITAFEVADNNKHLASLDGMLMGKYEGQGWQYRKKGELVRYPLAKTGECVLPETIRCVDDGAFEDCVGLTRVFIPKELTCVSRGAFHGCVNLSQIDVDPENEQYESLDGILKERHKDGAYSSGTLVAYPPARAVGDITIPAGFEAVGLASFWDCKKLRSVTFSPGLKRIDGACSPVPPFDGCTNLEQVNLPEGLELIENNAFYCGWGNQKYPKLKEVHIPKSVKDFGEDQPFFVLPEGTFQSPEKRPGCFADQLAHDSTRERMTPKDWAGILLFQTTVKFRNTCEQYLDGPMDPYVEGMIELLPGCSTAKYTKAAEFVIKNRKQVKKKTIQKLLDAATARKAKKAVELLTPLVPAPKAKDDPYAALRDVYPEPILLKSYKAHKGDPALLTKVKLANGKKAPAFLALCAIVPYADQYIRPTRIGSYEYAFINVGPDKVADEAAALLDKKSLIRVLDKLVKANASWYIPYCRYADGPHIDKLADQMGDWTSWYEYGATGRSNIITARGALMLSDTKEAVQALGWNNSDTLEEYAKRHNTTVDALLATFKS